jgi:hypothetical protein
MLQAVEGRERDFPWGSKRIVAAGVYDFFTADISLSSASKKTTGRWDEGIMKCEA